MTGNGQNWERGAGPSSSILESRRVAYNKTANTFTHWGNCIRKKCKNSRVGRIHYNPLQNKDVGGGIYRWKFLKGLNKFST